MCASAILWASYGGLALTAALKCANLLTHSALWVSPDPLFGSVPRGLALGTAATMELGLCVAILSVKGRYGEKSSACFLLGTLFLLYRSMLELGAPGVPCGCSGRATPSYWQDALINVVFFHLLWVCGPLSISYAVLARLKLLKAAGLAMLFCSGTMSVDAGVDGLPQGPEWRISGSIMQNTYSDGNTKPPKTEAFDFSVELAPSRYIVHTVKTGGSSVQWEVQEEKLYWNGDYMFFLAKHAAYPSTWNVVVSPGRYPPMSRFAGEVSWLAFASSPWFSEKGTNTIIPMRYVIGHHSSSTTSNTIRCSVLPPHVPLSIEFSSTNSVSNTPTSRRNVFGQRLVLAKYEVFEASEYASSFGVYQFPSKARFVVYGSADTNFVNGEFVRVSLDIEVANVSLAHDALPGLEVSGTANVSDLREYEQLGDSVSYQLTNKLVLPLESAAYVAARERTLERVSLYKRSTERSGRIRGKQRRIVIAIGAIALASPLAFLFWKRRTVAQIKES